MTLTQDQLDRYAVAFSSSDMLRHLGLTCSVSPHAVTIVLAAVDNVHRGGMGAQAVNGGVLSAMFDFALGNVGILVEKGTVCSRATGMISLGREVSLDEWCTAISNHGGT